jgi:hypothetical protein
MTRGRQANTAHVITGNTAPPGHEPYQQATPESVLASIMSRDDGDLSTTEQIRYAQDWAGGTGHLLTLWTAAIRQTLYPSIDQQITARLTETEACRYQREPSRQALQQRFRAAQVAGHDISALIDQITAAPMDGAQSIAGVLHGRLQRLTLSQLVQHDLTWAQRTPASAPAVAHELAAALDVRARVLGDQLTASPEPWLGRHLGVLTPGASPGLREEYTRRAAAAAAYREAAGITDPQQAVSPSSHRGNPELEGMRQATIRALEIRDEADIIRSLTRGELEARVLDAERAQASAPPEVSSQLRLIAQAEADAWQQAADAAIRHDHAGASDAQTLAVHIASHRRHLEAANTRYEQWSAATAPARETGTQTRVELEHRRPTLHPADQLQPESGCEPQTMTRWWQQLEAAVHCAFEREHQAAALAVYKPWPPQRTPETAQNSIAVGQEAASQPDSGDQAARLDELLNHAAAAAAHFAADNAERHARAGYAARIEREAQAEPEHALQAQVADEADMEM